MLKYDHNLVTRKWHLQKRMSYKAITLWYITIFTNFRKECLSVMEMLVEYWENDGSLVKTVVFWKIFQSSWNKEIFFRELNFKYKYKHHMVFSRNLNENEHGKKIKIINKIILFISVIFYMVKNTTDYSQNCDLLINNKNMEIKDYLWEILRYFNMNA